MKKIILSRKEKKIIRKGIALFITKSENNIDLFYITIAYALQHGYEMVSDDGNDVRLRKKNYKPPKYTPPKFYFDNDPFETITGT